MFPVSPASYIKDFVRENPTAHDRAADWIEQNVGRLSVEEASMLISQRDLQLIRIINENLNR